jgi:hypothetical protein
MSRNNNANTLANINDEVNTLMVTGKAGVTFEEAFEIARNTPVEVMQELSSEYFKEWGAKGTEHVFMVTGFGNVTLDGKDVPVVKFMDSKRRQLINGDKTFYSGCKRLDVALPAMVKVLYQDDVKGDAGTYKNLRVFGFSGK